MLNALTALLYDTQKYKLQWKGMVEVHIYKSEFCVAVHVSCNKHFMEAGKEWLGTLSVSSHQCMALVECCSDYTLFL